MASPLTPEQKRAIETESHCALSSCPGSGKTRTIVAKLIRATAELTETPRKCACITYTNAAVSEIELRLKHALSRDQVEQVEVGTIHSFCLNNIIRRYHHLLPRIGQGFSILTADSEELDVELKRLGKKYGQGIKDAEIFLQFGRDGTGRIVSELVANQQYLAEFDEWLVRNQVLTFSDIVFFSRVLVEKYGFIARAISSKFAWILLDEFQDTTADQVEIIKAIHEHGRSRFFLVGDTNQSIFGFAGADPSLMGALAKNLAARTDISLTGNHRCSSRIVQYAERICPGMPAMAAVGSSKDFPVAPEYYQVAKPIDGIVEYFLPAVDTYNIQLGQCAILAPQWFTLLSLGRSLREFGVPVIGPGARPYKRTREFAGFAEHVCAMIESRDPREFAGVQRAAFMLLNNLGEDCAFEMYSYDGKRAICRVLQAAREARESTPQAIPWLLEIVERFCEIFQGAEYLSAASAMRLVESVGDLVSEIKERSSDSANLSIEDISMFARPDSCIHLLTMHKAKGREFDAVAIVDLHEGKVPHWMATTPPQIAESRRLLYVAATRARKVLQFFTDTSDYRNRPSRFLGQGCLGLLR